jgi:hypothetical protein
VLFATPPSISVRSPQRTGAITPGMAALASTASATGPRESRSSWPVMTSTTTTCSGIGRSSSAASSPTWAATSPRSADAGTRWSRVPRNPSSPVSGFSGNTWPRRRPHHTAASASAASAVCGREAMNAPFIAPADVPTTRSGAIPRAYSAWSIPTWIAPSAAPPESTNATRGRGVMTS